MAIALEAYAVVSHLCLLRASQEREVRAAACLLQMEVCSGVTLAWGRGGMGVWVCKQL